MPEGPVTPWTWIAAVEATLGTMEHWATVARTPPAVYIGDPLGDLSQCDCAADGGGGQVLITHGTLAFTGDTFPQAAQQTRTFNKGCEDAWAVSITVDFARCRETMDPEDSRSFVAPEVRRVNGDLLLGDAWAIWSALRCASPQWNRMIGSNVVGPLGPIQRDLGQCSGYTFQIDGKVTPCLNCQTAT